MIFQSGIPENKTVEYYKNKTEFKRITQYENFDSVHYFYRNGNIFKRGKQLNEKQKFGKWVLSGKEGNIRVVKRMVFKEFKIKPNLAFK